ncbi:MAG: hypothetical protein AAF432_05730 [Planctomycetota bacterium]
MTEPLPSIQSVPWTELIPLGMITVLGLVMWLAGRRCLKAGFAAIGLVLGGSAGWIGASTIDVGIEPWIPAILGGLLLATIAALAYRLTLAATLAVVIGISGPVMVRTIAHARGMPYATEVGNEAGESMLDAFANDDVVEEEPDEIDQWLQDRLEAEARDEIESTVTDQIRETADRLGLSDHAEKGLEEVRTFGAWLRAALDREWARTPEAIRPTVLLAGVTGVLLGALLGAVAPVISASIVTAFGGSLLWLGGTNVFATRVGLPTDWMPESPAVWLLVWFIVACIGIAIQWTTGRKNADNRE